VARTIRVELKKIGDIVQVDHSLSRVEQIAQRKQAIYQYRNQCLSKQRQMVVDDHSIALSEIGKPYWVDQPSFHFNHSHSQNYYALATSERMQDLGVDVEELNRKVRFEALAKHAFHVEELRVWQQYDQDKAYWFKVWTTKEAVLKASGLGIRLNLNELNTQAHPTHNGGMCSHPLIGSF
jgi:4'-phosphopantetheinyl transferase